MHVNPLHRTLSRPQVAPGGTPDRTRCVERGLLWTSGRTAVPAPRFRPSRSAGRSTLSPGPTCMTGCFRSCAFTAHGWLLNLTGVAFIDCAGVSALLARYAPSVWS
jgi:hypothetical protein